MRQAFPLAALLLCACPNLDDDEGLACTTELRSNFCVTLNGGKDIPEGTTVYRIMTQGTDSLVGGPGRPPYASGNCMPEAAGASTVRVARNGIVVAEKQVEALPVVDGCHSLATTVDIAY